MSDIDCYFRNNDFSEWNRQAFLSENESNKPYNWTNSLRKLEISTSSSDSLLERVKARALLNADSLEYFNNELPKNWSYKDFASSKYKRDINCWTWALNEQLQHVKSAGAELAALQRCLKELAKTPAAPSKKAKRTRQSSSEPEPLRDDYLSRPRWCLKSERCVEEILSEDGRKLSKFFILDLDNNKWKKRFTPQERLEIESFQGRRGPDEKIWEVPELPDERRNLTSLIKDFIGQDDGRSQWLVTALVNLHSLYQNHLLSQTIGEVGYACIWSQILDPVLGNSGFYYSRGEQESLVEKALRDESELSGSGNQKKLDGILKGFHEIDPTRLREYGYIEVARDAQLKQATKRVNDELKMSLAMRISLLHQRGKDKGMKEDEWLKLCRVSVFLSGREMRILYLTPGKGSVFLLRRLQIVALPEQYDAKMIREVLEEIAYYRALVTGEGFLDGSLNGSLVESLDESLGGSLGGPLGETFGASTTRESDWEEGWVF